MADEILKVDENSRWVLGGVTNDANEFIRNARVNPVTGALLVEASIVSNNTSIGSTIPGGTEGSILFLGPGSTLAEDNANLFFDDTNNRVGIGNNTPTANLHVTGTARITASTGTPSEIVGRDGSGNINSITVGGGLNLAAGVLTATAGSAYNQIQQDSVNITQRNTLNFVDFFTVTDGGGTTNVTIDVVALASDNTFVTTIANNATFYNTLDLANISGQIDLTTQVTGQLPVANINVVALANDATFISNLEPNLDLANLGGVLDLTSQVTGILPVANGGTGANTLTGVLHGNGVAAVTAIPLTTDGAILIGDGAGAPTTLNAFTSSTGTLKLANGGTQASLSDPGANRLWGWDDTDNSIGFWTIGSGLSYDHATHTLSSTGSSGPYTVNADETENTYYSYQVPLIYNDAVATNGFMGWTNINIGDANGQGAAGAVEIPSSGGNSSITAILPGVTNNTDYRPSAGKIIRIKARMAWSTTANIKSFGMVDATATLYADQTSIDENFRFVENAGTLYATNADGTAVTSTDVSSGITRTDMNTYEIVFDPVGGGTPNVKFYINGTLVATHTTNIELGGIDFILGYGLNTNAQYIKAMPPIISLQM